MLQWCNMCNRKAVGVAQWWEHSNTADSPRWKNLAITSDRGCHRFSWPPFVSACTESPTGSLSSSGGNWCGFAETLGAPSNVDVLCHGHDLWWRTYERKVYWTRKRSKTLQNVGMLAAYSNFYSIASCMTLHDIAGHCMTLHDTAWHCMTLHDAFVCFGLFWWGAFAERGMGKHAMFIPALATTFLGLVYMTLRCATHNSPNVLKLRNVKK